MVYELNGGKSSASTEQHYSELQFDAWLSALNNFSFPTHPFEEKKHLSHLNLYKSCIIYPQKINNAYKVTTAE